MINLSNLSSTRIGTTRIRLGAPLLVALILVPLFSPAGTENLPLQHDDSGKSKTNAAHSSTQQDPGHEASEGIPEELKGQAWRQISAQIEADRHRIRPGDGQWQAHTPAQRYSTRFGPSGPDLEVRDGERSHSIGFRFEDARVDGQMLELSAPEPLAESNHMEYRRGALTEWYVNRPDGLEQGFTIDQAPAGASLSIELTLDTSLATNLTDDELVLAENGREVFRYSGLKAWDAAGRPLASRMALDRNRLTLDVDIADAQYPITVDPVMFNETAKLTAEVPPNAYGGDRDEAGRSVSIDGNRALIGAPWSSDGGLTTNGEAFIFELHSSSGNWHFVARLAPNDPGYGDQFGSTVSLSGDRALIGSYGDEHDGMHAGSAYIFDFDGTTWSQSAKLVADDGESVDFFGFSVSLSGNRALIGAYRDSNSNGSNSGSAYVFDFDGASWSQSAKLMPDDGTSEDAFGYSVSLSGDRALIGSPFGAGKDINSGSAYVFSFNGTAWSQSARLVSENSSGDNMFGWAVSLSGNRALVSDYGHHNVGDSYGAAFVFDFDDAAWHQSAKLTQGDGTLNDAFGYSVSLSGNRALVGAHEFDGFESSTGAAYVFDFDGTDWNRSRRLEADDGAKWDFFGFSVSLSGDHVLIGAYRDDDSGRDSGSAYVFDFDNATWVQDAKLVATGGAAQDRFGHSVSLSGDRALIGAYSDDDSGYGSGAAYLFEFDGGNWKLSAKLVPADATMDGRFGSAVSLSDDRALIGAYLAEGGGAAYVFDFDGTGWNESAKLVPSDSSPFNRFGWSVSLSGARALVGVNMSGPSVYQSGSAYVFEFNGAGWTQVARLVPDDIEGYDLFGYSVSLSGDRALVGSQEDDDNGDDSGSAYIFDFDGTSWSESAKLVASDGAPGDAFGSSVSLFTNRALVGAHRDDGDSPDTGSAYVFEFDGITWAQSAKLVPYGADESDLFGRAVSLFEDRALISATLDDDNGSGSGAAYIFDFDGSAWSESAKLTPADGAGGDHFGLSVSLSDERVLIGASGNDDDGTNSGSAYIFENVILFSDDFEE